MDRFDCIQSLPVIENEMYKSLQDAFINIAYISCVILQRSDYLQLFSIYYFVITVLFLLYIV